jgi:hypothetical protein
MKPSLLVIFENIQYLCKKKKNQKKKKIKCDGKYLAVTGMKKMQLLRRGFETVTLVSSVRSSTN